MVRVTPLCPPPPRLSLTRSPPGHQVKEGHDSTVRPKTRTWEFDNGRKFLDEWAADGKPALSKVHLQRVQMFKVLVAGLLLPPMILLIDSGGSGGETCFSPLQRQFQSWWSAFRAIDAADVAKARAVMPAKDDAVTDAPRTPRMF